VVILSDAPLLAAQLPGNPGRYQHFVVPRAALLSGDIDAHDLAWTGSQLCAANTRLSCIAAIDDDRHRRAQVLPGRAFWGEETAEECGLQGSEGTPFRLVSREV
jgi:Domain of unknown function (DUF4915)